MNSTASLAFMGSAWTIALAVVAVLVTTVLSFIAWRRSGYRSSIAALELLRLALVAAAGVLLNQPEWVETFRPAEKPTIAVLWDDSVSMGTRDADRAAGESTDEAPGLQTRREAIGPLASESTWASVAERYQVVTQPFSSEEGGGVTNLHDPLAAAAERFPRLRVIVLASDGDWNDGAPPVEAAARLRMQNVPVIAVPAGRREPLPDIQLASLDAPTFGVANKSVRIPFSIESTLPRAHTVTVTMKATDGFETSKEVTIAPQGRTSDWVVWKPAEVGDYEITLDVPQQPGEEIQDNNQLTAPISIREEKLRVLLVESVPRWEYRYLRNALSRDPGVEVACLLYHPGLTKVGGGNRDYIQKFPEGRDELAKFDVVFLGDVGIDDGQLTPEDCHLLRGLIEQQASGLVFLPGMYGRQFSLLDTELADLYPVVLNDAQPSGWGARLPSQFQLTAAGQRSLLTKLADTVDENIDVWDGLPGFQWYAPVERAKAGTEVLCVHQEASNQYGRLPLLVTQTFGAGKVLFMGTDAAWRWRKGVEDKYHYRFWAQVVRWMAYRRHMAAGESMRLYYTPDQPGMRQTVALTANVMAPSGEPLSEGEVVARIVAPSGRSETIRLTAVGDEWGAFAGSYTTREPGAHAVTLSSPTTGGTLETSLFVQGAAQEPVGRPARPEVLEEIARITHGAVLPAGDVEQMVQFVSQLPESPPAVRRLRLWADPRVAGTLVTLLGVFWIGRKAVGLI
ncbi:MAG: hypothetical protein CMJ58_25005 [Planctomycetaceae bacterium]|nr:hypothetical protein [Planctomycetaceae bacterium]